MTLTKLMMEDLSGLEKLLPRLVLNLVFAQGDKGIIHRTSQYRKVYVHLIDKAIDEYQESRNLVIAAIDEPQRSIEDIEKNGRYIYEWKFVDHMENCISTLNRILRLFNHLKGNQDNLTFSQETRKRIEYLTKSTSIVRVRNTLEHIDERIRNDIIQENETLMLTIADSQDGIMIGSESLKFSDISILIRKLHSLGQQMAQWRVSDSV
jgi:hypothetical protein